MDIRTASTGMSENLDWNSSKERNARASFSSGHSPRPIVENTCLSIYREENNEKCDDYARAWNDTFIIRVMRGTESTGDRKMISAKRFYRQGVEDNTESAK